MDCPPEALPDRACFDYAKLPFRRQHGAGLSKAPAEVKRIIARECYAQDCALLETCKQLEKRFHKHVSAPATLRGLDSLRRTARTSAMLRLVSREWRDLVTPYFFSELDMQGLRHLDPAIEQHREHFRSLKASTNRTLLEWVLKNLPNIEDIDVSRFGPIFLQAEPVMALFSRATTIRGLKYASLFTGLAWSLPSFQNLRHLGVSVTLFPTSDTEEARQLWTILADAPHLQSLEINVEVGDEPNRPCDLRPLLPPASRQIPAISHLRLSTNMIANELVGLTELIETFASTLVTLKLRLIDDQGIRSDATFRLLHGSRIPLLCKIDLECSCENRDPTTGMQIRLHPRLYPPLAEMSLSTQGSLNWSYEFEEEEEEDDELAHPRQAFEADGLVELVDEMIEFLASWRDCAVESGDVVGLQQLARTLVDADFARVAQRA